MRRRLFGALAAVGATALLAGGCSGRQTLSQWAQSSGVIGLDNTVFFDVHGIFGATKAHKPATLIATICDTLGLDASTAYDSVLLTPNHQLSIELSNAYDDLQNGAQDCSTSVGGTDAASTAKAYQVIMKGDAELQSTTNLMSSLGIH